MNAIDLLIQDHALVKKLLEELCATTQGSAVKTRRHRCSSFIGPTSVTERSRGFQQQCEAAGQLLTQLFGHGEREMHKP